MLSDEGPCKQETTDVMCVQGRVTQWEGAAWASWSLCEVQV